MKTQPIARTPTPLSDLSNEELRRYLRDGIQFGAELTFIVRAINAHEELVRVAKYAACTPCDKTNNCAHCLGEQAIAKAEAQ